MDRSKAMLALIVVVLLGSFSFHAAFGQLDRHEGRRGDFMPSPRFDDFPARLPYFSGQYYSLGFGTNSSENFGLDNDRLYAIPIHISHPRTFDRIGCHVLVSDAGTANIVMGIYLAAPDGLPGDLLIASETSVFSLNSTGAKEETINMTLSPDWYWLAMSTQIANSPEVVAVAAGRGRELLGASGLATAGASAIKSTFTYTGSMPDPYDRTSLSRIGFVSSGEFLSTVPRIMLRAE